MLASVSYHLSAPLTSCRRLYIMTLPHPAQLTLPAHQASFSSSWNLPFGVAGRGPGQSWLCRQERLAGLPLAFSQLLLECTRANYLPS